MPIPIFGIWLAGIALKAFAAYRIASKSLFSRLPIVWAFLVLSVVRSAVLVWLRSDRYRYATVSGDTMPMMLLSEAFAVVSVFWLVTENFPKWRKPGTISLSAMAVLGGAVAILLRTSWVPKDWASGWASSWEFAVLLDRHAMTAMAVVLAGTRVLLAIARIVPVSPLARRAADILTIHVFLELAGSALTIMVGKQFPPLAFVWPTASGVLVGLLWAFWLPAASDVRQHSRRSAGEGRIDWRAGVADLLGRIGLQFDVKAR